MIIRCIRGGVNRLREQIARELERSERKMTRTWREMLKIVLAESKRMIKKVLLNIITATYN